MKLNKSLCSYKGMTARNIKVYLKDKMAIILSIITQIIVLGLYLLFLKQNYVDAVTAQLGELNGLITDKQIQALVNSWLISGVIGTSVVTVALNSLSVMVQDKQDKIDFDYNASPIKGSTVVLSYFSGAVVNTILISAIMLTAGFVFIAATGGFIYTITDLLSVYGLVILGSVSATLMLMFIASFFKKSSTLSSFGVLISAAIGFVIGAYIPVSQFGDGVQTAVNLVPGSQIAAMMRNVLMTPAINSIDESLGSIDNGLFAQSMEETFSLKLRLFDGTVDFTFMMIFSLAVIALFLVLNLISFRLSSKRKA